MGLLDEVKQHFGVSCLYDALQVDSKATESDLKRAYRKLSLKHHPDKFAGDVAAVERQTLRFQTLAKVHKILSDDRMRALYDEQGLVLDEDSVLNEDADWSEYWRLLFPKITKADVENYMKKYTGSEEELQDLKDVYIRCEGDMNCISECFIGFEEERTRQMLNKLIEQGEVEAFPKFVKEKRSSIERRKRRMEKERRDYDKDAKYDNDNGENDLILAIENNRQKREQGFDAMIAQMEAKYGAKKTKNSNKRQRKN